MDTALTKGTRERGFGHGPWDFGLRRNKSEFKGEKSFTTMATLDEGGEAKTGSGEVTASAKGSVDDAMAKLNIIKKREKESKR